MNNFNFLKPDSPLKKIEGKEEIKQNYRYWRMRIFYSIYVGYALFYFTRKSFAFTMPALGSSLGFDKAELGFILSLGSISYAVSKFLSGFISDKANLRLLMSIGLILTGVFNIFCGFSSSIFFFALFMGLNGFFQGWGAPPCAKLLTYWYSQKERGRWWGLWNTSHNIGGALIPLACAFAIGCFGKWNYGLHLPAVLAIVVGIFLMNRLRDRPTTVGLPPVETFRSNRSDAALLDADGEKKFSSREILVEHVLKNKFIWLLGFSFFFIYIIRQAVNDWMVHYLVEEKGYTLLTAGSGIFWFEIGGGVGSLAAGYLSDTVFGGKRGPVNLLFTLGIFFGIIGVWLVPAGNVFLLSSAMFLVGFLIFGPQMLIGMAAAELAHKGAAGTATGFVGFFAYLGGSMAGYPCGKIADDFGWAGLFILLIACAAVTMILLLPLVKKKAYSVPIET